DRIAAERGLLPAGALSPAAVHDLRSALLGRLAALCGRALQREFVLERSRRCSGFDLALREQGGNRELYEAFVRETARGLPRFFDRYPVLARLVGAGVED